MTAPRSIPKPREPTERDFTKQVIDLAQRYGWRVAHFRTAMTQAGNWVTPVQGDGKGWPDLFMVRDGKALAIELKVGYNKLAREQTQWLFALHLVGITVDTWYPKDWGEIEATLKGER